MQKGLSTQSSKVTAASLLVALGIIYGDIGTSPLYVMKAIAGERSISEDLVFGGVSCVFWTLVIQTTLKYIWLTLRADNEGEGGIFSLYALVRRYGKKLVIPTIAGATALLADGIITPPISVASAVEGLTLVEGLEELPTVPIVVAILSLLFFFQRFGTQKIGKVFGPMMVLWFGMLFGLGLSQLTKNPAVIKALHPQYAYQLLSAYPNGFWLLGAVFLATTGAEALYSDLGHCGRKNIRISWLFVKTALVTNYLGQAAWMSQHIGESLNGRNPFFQLMPDWFLFIGIGIATAATIIASQALISGSYTLVNEAMNLNFWPRVKVKQPSESKGQIYIPSVNTLLWIGCILMILYFRTSSEMEAAYGFSISVAMIMTSILLSYFLVYTLKWNKLIVGGLMLVFLSVETAFLTANIAKIQERWMFLFFELFIFLTMYIWYYARKSKNRFTRFVEIGAYTQKIEQLIADTSIPRFTEHLVYLTKANNRHEVEEKIIHSIFARKPKRARVYWLLHIHRTEQPYTLNYDVSELIEGALFKINISIGFRIQPKSELYFKHILNDLEMQGVVKNNNDQNPQFKYNPEHDFTFVVIERFLSVENEFSLREGLLLNAFFQMKKLSLSDEKAFGLDKSDVVLEQIPLVYQPDKTFNLTRI